MTPCEQLKKAHVYHDGELSADDAMAFEVHMRDCPACQAELAEIQQVSLQFQQYKPSLPLDLVNNIKLRVRRETERGTLQLVRWLSMAAAMVLCVSLVQLSTTDDNSITGNGTSLASATLPMNWETAAVQLVADSQNGSSITDEQRIAQWMVQDLSGRSTDRASDTSGSKLHE